MTLEDFFTLTEMKDGLTAPYRVRELVAVMQKEKDYMAKNAGDATRQWASVASTIAATENKDCLDLFLQLDGLWYINRWLKDAQNFGVDTNGSFVEESITAMLRAVEKLHLDSEKSISSGIHITVNSFLGHCSPMVQDRARELFNSWKGDGNGDAESHDMELDKVNNSSDTIVKEEGQSSALDEAGTNNNHVSGFTGSEKSLLRSSDNLLPERNSNVLIQSSDNVLQSSVSVECKDIKDRSPNYLAVVLYSDQKAASSPEGLPLRPAADTTSVGTCSFPTSENGSVRGQPDCAQLNDLDKKENQEANANSLPEPEICPVSSKLELESVSIESTEAKAVEPEKEPALEHNVENNEDGVCHKINSFGSMSTPVYNERSRTDDSKATTSIAQLVKAAENDDGCFSNALQDPSISGSNLGKTEDLEMSAPGVEYVREVKEGKGQVCNDGRDTSNGSNSSTPGKDFRSLKITDMKCSDNELDSGIVDALDFARQVAQEIEREVCSSSSEKISEMQPGSPDSVRKEDERSQVSAKEVSSRQSHTAESHSPGEHATISDNIDGEPECIPDVESLGGTEVARDSGGNSEKRLCAFDLNEVNFDDMDASQNTMSTPIPVVSALRPGPSSGLLGTPLQFEGTLGWKGSASTSAFRPASPHKNCDSERNLSTDGNSAISKQRQDSLDFDLNVADDEEELVKPIGESSSLPSGQSSLELSPKRSNRLELDLNCTGDDGDAQPSDHRMEGQLFLGRNGHWSPSPASSSSTVQPSVRNIDLNDRPFLQTDLVDQGRHNSSHINNAYGYSKSSDAPVISILGARVEVGRREHVPHTFFLGNGKTIESAIDLTIPRTSGILGIHPTASYNHSTIFGYNGVAQASVSGPPLSFSPSIYGSGSTIPYMVDSRGAPVVPQVGGSSPSVLSSYSQSPIIMNMTSTQLGLNGFGPSRPNLDLNSGFMIEGGNRDTLAARQFFFPSQGRTMEDHVRTMPQTSTSEVGGKRKEPDSGWESYPFSYKHPQPPWK